MIYIPVVKYFKIENPIIFITCFIVIKLVYNKNISILNEASRK